MQAKQMNEKIFSGKLMELKGRSLVENGGHGRTTVQVRADEKLGEALMSSSSRGTTRTSEKGYGTSMETPPPKSTSPIKPTSKTEPKKKVEKMATSPSTATPATASPMTPLEIDAVYKHRVGDIDRGGGDGSGDGRGDQIPEGQEGEGVRSRMSHLWDALSGLRARMKAGMCRQRLDAADGANTTTSTMSPTRNSQQAQEIAPATDTTIDDSTTNPATCLTCACTSSVAAGAAPSYLNEEFEAVNNVRKKQVRPSLAKRLAIAAAMTVSVMEPVRELVNMTSPQVDLMEIACSKDSLLTKTFEEAGFQCQRINYLSGYDLDARKGTSKLDQTIKTAKPRLAWVSFRCTRLSALQNLTERSPEEMDKFLKRRGNDLRRCDEISASLDHVLASGGDVAWEWPTTAAAGWRSRAIDRLTKMLRRHGRGPYWIRIDGCAYGLQWQGTPLRKAWTILTSSRELWLTLNKRCDRSHEHAECRGMAAQASSYYPQRMCKEILKGMKHAWQQQVSSLEKDVEKHIFQVMYDQDQILSRRLPEGQRPGSTMAALLDDVRRSELPGLVEDELQHLPEHEILALSRKRIDAGEAPKGKHLEAVKQLMLRVHRANLVQLLKARGSPGWALELAANLECPECKEASKPRPRPPAGTNETPNPFEQIGTDVFEYEEKDGVKHKMILWRDRATGLTMVDHLARYESGAWEPKSQNIVESLTKWLMTSVAFEGH